MTPLIGAHRCNNCWKGAVTSVISSTCASSATTDPHVCRKIKTCKSKRSSSNKSALSQQARTRGVKPLKEKQQLKTPIKRNKQSRCQYWESLLYFVHKRFCQFRKVRTFSTCTPGTNGNPHTVF